jgi:Carboxypeptidase regulatory-like domain
VSIDGRQSKAVVFSDANGNWSVEDLVAGAYRVRARLGSQRAGSVELPQPVLLRDDIKAPPPVLLRLETGRSVRGVVTGSDGQPLAGAVVSVRGTGAQAIATDGSGEFLLELPERAIDLVVSHGDRSRSRTLQVSPGQQLVDVRLDTPPTCTVTARIAGLPGRRRVPSGVLRWARLDGADGAIEGDAMSRWTEFLDGELRWSSAPVGRIRLEIWCDGYAPFVTEQALIANQEHALGDVLLEPGGRLLGVVRDAAGAPVAGAVVLLGEETDLDLFEGRTRTAADGSFRLAGVTGRSSRLVARAPGFAPSVVELQLPEDLLSAEPLAIRLERGAVIEVSVGSSLARDGGVVQLRRGSRVLATAELDDTGRAAFANRGVGVYSVQLLDREVPPKSVRIEAGDSLRRIQLP